MKTKFAYKQNFIDAQTYKFGNKSIWVVPCVTTKPGKRDYTTAPAIQDRACFQCRKHERLRASASLIPALKKDAWFIFAFLAFSIFGRAKNLFHFHFSCVFCFDLELSDVSKGFVNFLFVDHILFHITHQIIENNIFPFFLPQTDARNTSGFDQIHINNDVSKK